MFFLPIFQCIGKLENISIFQKILSKTFLARRDLSKNALRLGGQRLRKITIFNSFRIS